MFEGHHDADFSRNREFYFNANTLNNAERHMLEIHMLDAGGDTWTFCGEGLLEISPQRRRPYLSTATYSANLWSQRSVLLLSRRATCRAYGSDGVLEVARG